MVRDLLAGLAAVVLLVGTASISHGAVFSDNFDDPGFTDTHWTDGNNLVPQTWSFVALNGSDLGYHATIDVPASSTGEPAAKIANNAREYYNAGLHIETFVRIDSHDEAYSTTNKAIISFTASEETQYLAQLRLDYYGVQTPITDLYLSVHSDGPPDQEQILMRTPVAIDFDTFYRLVIRVDSDQAMDLSLYNLDNTLLGNVSSPKVLPADYGAVAIGGRYKTTFNDFFLSGSPVQMAEFIPTGSMSTGTGGHTATLLQNGNVLIAGGCYDIDPTSGIAFPRNSELYDPASGTFSLTGNMVFGRCNQTATLLPNGKVLITGGASDGADFFFLRAAEVYDPEAGHYTLTGEMTSGRSGHTSTLLANGKVLIAGGAGNLCSGDRDDVLKSAELYDPQTGTFTPTGDLTGPRVGHTATLLSSGKVLIVGGASTCPSKEVLSQAEIYDPTAGTFSAVGDLVNGRQFHTATLLSTGKVLIAGGTVAYDEYLSSSELYNPNDGTFSGTGDMITARNSHAATLLSCAKVLITGGQDNAGALDSAELYDFAKGKFSNALHMVAKRSSHTATLLPNCKVLLAGGFYPIGMPLASAEVYSRSSVTGDINGDGYADLVDAILALKIASGQNPVCICLDAGAKVNNGCNVGVSEAIYALQKIAGLR